jgi:DNA-binding transcriptional ArsR family regulator
MEHDVDLAPVAQLIGEPTRATMLGALCTSTALPATELARLAGVSPATASVHLAKLVAGGLLAVEPNGRHRYFRLAGPAVARALEALALLAPAKPVRSLRDAAAGTALRAARTCYDHLAGRLGVTLAESLERRGVLRLEAGAFVPTTRGERELADLGLDLDGLKQRRRAFARACLDWSERRYHLAGALGAALTDRFFELGWIERRDGTRAVALTASGSDELRERFGLMPES